MATPLVAPADIYDTLEFIAEGYGGVGAWYYYDYDHANTEVLAPVCIHGMAYWSTPIDGPPIPVAGWVVANISIKDNDRAVEAVNKRQGRNLDARVPFAEWCAELNIVRGE